MILGYQLARGSSFSREFSVPLAGKGLTSSKVRESLNSALAVMSAAFAKGCAQTRAAAINKITRFMLPPRCFSTLLRAARSDAKPV
jgi:hypothetical protein